MQIKKISSTLVLITLLGVLLLPDFAYAGSAIHFTVINKSGHRIKNLRIDGPFFRTSQTKTLRNGGKLEYYARGDSCHSGMYELTNYWLGIPLDSDHKVHAVTDVPEYVNRVKMYIDSCSRKSGLCRVSWSRSSSERWGPAPW